MKSNLIIPEILHIQFDNKYLLCSSFMRLQEFYESDIPGFAGRYFSREEFEDAYANRFDNFTYYTDWCGFNIPISEINKFVELFKSKDIPYSKEQALLDEIYKPEHDKVLYVIGTHDEYGFDLETLKHELSHAFFAINAKYREAGIELITKFFKTTAGKIEQESLREKGYHEKVLIDEALAYGIEKKNAYKKLFKKACKELNIKI